MDCEAAKLHAAKPRSANVWILSGPLGTCLVAAALLSSIKDAVDRKAHVLFGVSTVGNVCR